MFDFSRVALSADEVALSLAVVLAAGFLRGFTGFGFAMVAVPLLALALPPAEVVPVVILLQLLIAVWDWRDSRRNADWRSLPWLLAGALAGTPLGTYALASMSDDAARLAIGGAVAIAVLLLGRGFRLATMPSRPALCATGLAAGVLNGLAAMPGPPVIVLFLAGPVPIITARASLLAFFAIGNVASAASAGATGLIGGSTLVLALAGLPLMLFGQWLGRRAFNRSNERRYRQIATAFLAVLSAATIVRAMWGLLQAP